MAQPQEAPGPAPRDTGVNFFRPRPGFMRKKVMYTWLLLLSWAIFTFGFQFVLALQDEGSGGLLTETVILGFPFHYWFTGQFLIVWFILLCFLFNTFVDRLTKIYQKRK